MNLFKKSLHHLKERRWIGSLAIVIVLLAVLVFPSIQAAASWYPTFSIVSVVADGTVTIKGYNFPAGDNYNVRMGPYGYYGVGGALVDTQATGSGGSFTATYTIPASLYGQTQIAIRLESPTTGYYAYNWFWNNTASSGWSTAVPTATPGGPTSTPAPTSTGSLAPDYGYPYFYITGVDRDNTVTVAGYNFTKNDSYTVRMNYFGTAGYGGWVSDASFATDADGNFTASFAIPGSLAGADRIAIRMDSNTSPYYAYNWFWNFDYP